MSLACRLFFLLKSGPGTATVAPPWMLLSMCPPMQPFAKLPVHQREAILQWWSVNPIPLMKKVLSSAFLGLHACSAWRHAGTFGLSQPAASTSFNAPCSIPLASLGAEPCLSPLRQAFCHRRRLLYGYAGTMQPARTACFRLGDPVPTCSAQSTVGASA